MWHWDTQLFQSVTHGYVLVTATFSFDTLNQRSEAPVHQGDDSNASRVAAA
jgi:hypothetical protein